MKTVIVYEGTPGERHRGPDVIVVGAAAESIADVAASYVDAGATRIELCGGVSLQVVADTRAAVGEQTSLGVCRYTYDAVPALAAFRASEEAQQALPVAFIWVDPSSEGGVITHRDGTFIAIAHSSEASSAIRRVGPAPHGLIELYCGLGASEALAVAKVAGSTPVGFVNT